MEHLKKQNLQHAVMPVEVFALRKRRTSSQNMCYRLLRFTAESALHVTFPSSSCLFSLVDSCIEHLLVQLIDTSNHV